jgi:hypothetical protein
MGQTVLAIQMAVVVPHKDKQNHRNQAQALQMMQQAAVRMPAQRVSMLRKIKLLQHMPMIG